MQKKPNTAPKAWQSLVTLPQGQDAQRQYLCSMQKPCAQSPAP